MNSLNDSKFQTLDELYQGIISSLKQEKRPHVTLTEEQEKKLVQTWVAALKDPIDEENLSKVLCILEHSRKPLNLFNELFIKTLSSAKIPNEIKALALGTSIKHVIGHSQIKGIPIPYNFMECLKLLIHPKQDPELLEWLLRTTESMGKQSIKLKKEIIQSRPSILSSTLSPHKKACRQIIDLLEKNWRSYLA